MAPLLAQILLTSSRRLLVPASEWGRQRRGQEHGDLRWRERRAGTRRAGVTMLFPYTASRMDPGPTDSGPGFSFLVLRSASCNSQLENSQLATSPDRDRPEAEPGGGATDAVGHAHVTEFVDAVLRQLFQIVEFADVHALLDEQVTVDGDERGLVFRPGALL